jgi:hypothetical protein
MFGKGWLFFNDSSWKSSNLALSACVGSHLLRTLVKVGKSGVGVEVSWTLFMWSSWNALFQS